MRNNKISDIYLIESPKPPISHTVEEAIEVIGVGKVQICGVVASLLCLMNYVLDVIGVSFIIPAATCDLQMDTYKKGLLTSVPFLGLTLTAHLWGFMADSIGRKKSICWSLSLALFFSSLVALSPNYWIMLILRLLSGMSFSGATSAMYPFIGELLPKKTRSKLMVMFGFAVGIGMLLTAGVGFLLQNYATSFQITGSYAISPWRMQILVLLIPGSVALLIYSHLPESPKFLMSIGESGKALEVLENIHQRNCNGKEDFPIKVLTEEHEATDHSTSLCSLFRAFKEETKTLFRKPFLWPMLGCCFIQYGIFTVGAGFQLWYPEITNKLADPSGLDGGVCAIFTKSHTKHNVSIGQESIAWEDCHVEIQDKMYIDNMFMAVGYLTFNTIFYVLNTKIELVYLWIVSVVISAISAFILPSLTNELAILIIFTVFLLGSGASINVFNVIVVEVFPTHLCGMALSLALLTGRLATFIGGNGLGVLLETHCEKTIYLVASLVASCVVCGFYLPKKVTKGE